MTVEGESELRMALRHAKTGQDCIARQLKLIAVLRGKGLPTEEAETVLHWLEEVQRGFEDHYEKLLSAGFARTGGQAARPPQQNPTGPKQGQSFGAQPEHLGH